MRILVAIADHGTGARHHLDRLLREYRSMPDDVDLVVLSDIPKDLGPDVEVRVGAPSDDPWSLPFAHRPLFIDRAGEYDLFVYSENDTLITRRNIEAFLEVSTVLEPDEIPGFLRSELDEGGDVHYPMIHGAFRWLPETLRRRGVHTLAAFTNEHAASYLLTREQLKTCIASGGYVTEPHAGRHDMLCAAATDPYTRCGLTRLVCLSRIDDFTLPHLSNRYVRTRGVSRRTLDAMIEAVEVVGDDGGWTGPLVEPENRLPSGAWWKDLYELPCREVVELVPPSVDVLVVGCGWGATEGVLVDRGHRVTALAVDPVLGRLAAARGVEVVRAGLDDAPGLLDGRRFGCLVLPDLLHLVDDPAALIRRFLPAVDPDGALVASVPNVWWPDLGRRVRRAGPRARGFDRSGVHSTRRSSVDRWLEGTGFATAEVSCLPGRRALPDALTTVAGPIVAGGFVARAQRPVP